MTELPLGNEFISAAEDTSSAASKPIDGSVLKSDLRKLQSILMTGDESVARRKDIGELHKRVVSLFTTLNQGISDQSAAKAAEDRAKIDDRLIAMERAINSMEGALRIELAPLLKSMLQEAIQTQPATRGTTRLIVPLTFAVLCGTGLGFFMSGNISALASYAAPLLSQLNLN